MRFTDLFSIKHWTLLVINLLLINFSVYKMSKSTTLTCCLQMFCLTKTQIYLVYYRHYCRLQCSGLYKLYCVKRTGIILSSLCVSMTVPHYILHIHSIYERLLSRQLILHKPAVDTRWACSFQGPLEFWGPGEIPLDNSALALTDCWNKQIQNIHVTLPCRHMD